MKINMRLITVKTLYNLNITIEEKKQIKINDWLIIFRNPTEKEKLKKCIVCELRKKINPNKQLLNVFNDLSIGKVPKDSTPKETILKSKTYFKNKHIPSLQEMPINFQRYIKEEKKDENLILNNILKIIKWRYNIDGEIKYSHRDDFFLLNKKRYSLPHQIQVEISMIKDINLDDINLYKIKSLIRKNINLASYDFVLNIEKIISQDIVAGYIQCYAALEIGIKEFLSFLSPNLAEFFMDIPSPPLAKILKRINNIPLKNQLIKETFFHNKLSKKITNIAEIRNKLIHKGELSNDSIKDKKNDIKIMLDFMYLLYYYRGFNWAKDHISEAFQLEYLL